MSGKLTKKRNQENMIDIKNISSYHIFLNEKCLKQKPKITKKVQRIKKISVKKYVSNNKETYFNI